jgi:hypothetical protein
VVWAGGNNRDPKSLNRLDTIFLYEKNKKETQSLFETKQNGQADETQINNNWICWVDWSDENGADWVIHAYSRQNQDIIQIASSKDYTRPKKGSLPRLSLSDNDYLSWIEEKEVENATISELRLIHIPSKKVETIAEVDYDRAIPHISENYLAWSNEKSIYVYSLQKKELVEKINTNQVVNFPKVNDGIIVWQELGSKGSTNSILNLKPIGKEIDPIEIFQGNIFFYDIGNDYVILQTKDKIQAYSIGKKTVEHLGNGFLPYIRGSQAVWEVGRENDYIVLQVIKLK